MPLSETLRQQRRARWKPRVLRTVMEEIDLHLHVPIDNQTKAGAWSIERGAAIGAIEERLLGFTAEEWGCRVLARRLWRGLWSLNFPGGSGRWDCARVLSVREDCRIISWC